MKKQKRLKPRNDLIPILFNECGHAVHKNKRREERDRRVRQEIKTHTRESGYFFQEFRRSRIQIGAAALGPAR